MLELLKKTMLTGIGLASMTKEKIEELGSRIAEESKLSEEEGRKLVEELLSRSNETKKDLETQVEKLVKDILEKLQISSREDLKTLENRIIKLEKASKNKENTK